MYDSYIRSDIHILYLRRHFSRAFLGEHCSARSTSTLGSSCSSSDRDDPSCSMPHFILHTQVLYLSKSNERLDEDLQVHARYWRIEQINMLLTPQRRRKD